MKKRKIVKNSSLIEKKRKSYGIKTEESEESTLEVKISKIGKTEIYKDGKIHGSQG